MKPEERRDAIVRTLQASSKPVSATRLSEMFEVSRQIIVQDIALIRAGGVTVTALSRGYVLEQRGSCQRVFKLCHSDEDTERELNLIVDAGGTVKDVFVFHKVYGTVRAEMGISSRLHVARFLQDVASGKSGFLKNVTAGYHYHTVCADHEAVLDLIEQLLTENNFIAPLQPYEPVGLVR